MSAEQTLATSYTSVGLLLVAEGLAFLLCPHLTTKLLFLAPLQTTQAEQYVRTTGLALVVIGYYYFMAGKSKSIDFFRASIIGRLSALPIIVAMIYFYSLEGPLIVLGVQDLLTALWSHSCMKAYDAEQKTRKK